ncbi:MULTISPECIES: FUSC family protein [Streptomycetaceae]|uniref:Integral membrane protein n=1 Tax=Streptantibioticus cattleyicolor (strain ATCC 35852 / DSM 46488 / JCM 4925 / NBRC 14057 / NRRL 8057) TaxID=1003195 RepID=F8K343_STREN|nr:MULTISPECIES: FUSC family protein [Streptomycetaceae]AEW93754.1 integral membrane protein [Streptantibioticus cattleyicolor NRRL 8057 = DSM 46488]MYS58443.1 FUSC family protein [Streptomyces sp. SID5468]CCB74102.1 putative membrane protein [Streptantibioticus cattleyicolor NRRL 8057 = DSM 46488]
MYSFRPALPDWLTHPVRGLRGVAGPVPWGAVLRGALGVGPVLGAGVAAGRPAMGVMAGLGAMFAHVNDVPATRSTRVVRIGLPALAGALGLLAGAWLGGLGIGMWIALGLAVVGLVSGAVSAIGPVCSAAGVQLVVLAIVGAGMPLPISPPVRAALLLAGAGWVILWATLLPRLLPRRRHGAALPDDRYAVAAVYDALAALLAAVGTERGRTTARRRLTKAYDTAYEALYVHRLPGRRPSAGERLLRDRLAVAGALSEAALTLLWEGTRVPSRVARTPALLARSIRTGRPPGPLAAPAPSTPGGLAAHRAVLLAARVFDGEPAPAVGAVGPGWRERLRRLTGSAGREYAARVALCVGVGTVLARWLAEPHWYWLPATAAFLVKPDLGPLFSRAVCRALGTAVGVAAFAGLDAVAGPHGAWPVGVAAVCAALIPVSVRHFATQTAVLTPLLLALVQLGGDPGAGYARLVDTLLGCAVVLAAGALPGLGGPRAQVSVRLSLAVRATRDHLDRVLAAEAPYPVRLRLRREAYRALAEARRAVEVAGAEHPPFGRDLAAWAPVVTALEEIVDAATACGVRLDLGAAQPDPALADRLRAGLSDLAEAVAARRPPAPVPLPAAPAVAGCPTLADVTAGLRKARRLAAATAQAA